MRFISRLKRPPSLPVHCKVMKGSPALRQKTKSHRLYRIGSPSVGQPRTTQRQACAELLASSSPGTLTAFGVCGALLLRSATITLPASIAARYDALSDSTGPSPSKQTTSVIPGHSTSPRRYAPQGTTEAQRPAASAIRFTVQSTRSTSERETGTWKSSTKRRPRRCAFVSPVAGPVAVPGKESTRSLMSAIVRTPHLNQV
mmetsp:Transcript_45321/g.101317  ORF Transcript_45321/g.101317 Transcript_45321/m.101317 type:complete len:201 (+) Transcript_45321:402-1004(+)